MVRNSPATAANTNSYGLANFHVNTITDEPDQSSVYNSKSTAAAQALKSLQQKNYFLENNLKVMETLVRTYKKESIEARQRLGESGHRSDQLTPGRLNQ